MYYIGCHWGSVEDGYICSSNRMRDAYRRRPQDFKRRILFTNIQTREETLEKEHQLFSMIEEEELGAKYYNLRKHKWGHWVTDENCKLKIGEKISKSRTGKKYSKRRPRTEEEKKKISENTKLAMKIYFSKPDSRKFGEENSQFGTVWVTDGNSNKKIKKELLDEHVKQGFYKGRVNVRKQKHSSYH
jgi:hypothetical protein